MAKPGERIGFGIHYNPDVMDKPEFNDKEQQLVLCFVTVDMEIIFFKIMIQPAGGFYPLVILCKNGKSFTLTISALETKTYFCKQCRS